MFEGYSSNFLIDAFCFHSKEHTLRAQHMIYSFKGCCQIGKSAGHHGIEQSVRLPGLDSHGFHSDVIDKPSDLFTSAKNRVFLPLLLPNT